MEDFKIQLDEIKKFITSKKKLNELADRAGVKVRTVYNTFNAEKFDDLKGVHLTVYQEAIKMVAEIKALPGLASEVLNK